MSKFSANMKAGRALALHSARKEDKARELYAQAYDEGTTNVSALAAYGLMLLREFQDEKAIEVLKKATKEQLKPNQWLIVYQNLGIAYWLSGNLDRALRLFERIYERNQSANVRGTYGCLLIEKAKQTGDFAAARQFCEGACEYDDEDAVIIDNMAQIELQTGNAEKAEALFERALQFKDDQFDSLCALAKLRIEQGREDDARQLLTKALQKKPSRFNTIPRGDAVRLAASIGLDDPSTTP